MNNGKTTAFREQISAKARLILWIIGSIIAILGAYYSQFGILFHLKSAILTWFSAWIIFFGWILQTWYFSTSESERNNMSIGIMTLSNSPLLLSDYLMISGLIGMAVNPLFLLGWIISAKILIKYFMTNTLNLNVFGLENITFTFGKFKESNQKLNIIQGMKSASTTMILCVILLLPILKLRSNIINRTLPIEIEIGGIILLCILSGIKIILSLIQQPNTTK